MSLRFDTRNQNAECKRCNRFSSDHLIGYRKNLVMKLGRLAYLQKHPHVPLDMEESKAARRTTSRFTGSNETSSKELVGV